MNNEIKNLIKEIDKIDWTQYETAYNDTGEKIAGYLKDLFCEDRPTILKATNMLWCSLCHQHAYITSASLPAYEFLLYALLNLDDYIKIEILDIFTGFAVCTSYQISNVSVFNKSTSTTWIYQLREKLKNNLEIFKSFNFNTDEDISCFSKRICEYLEK